VGARKFAISCQGAGAQISNGGNLYPAVFKSFPLAYLALGSRQVSAQVGAWSDAALDRVASRRCHQGRVIDSAGIERMSRFGPDRGGNDMFYARRRMRRLVSYASNSACARSGDRHGLAGGAGCPVLRDGARSLGHSQVMSDAL
jgi:hypothetical protein